MPDSSATTGKSVFILFMLFSFTFCNVPNDYLVRYGDEISFTCNHSQPSNRTIGWQYQDKYDNNDLKYAAMATTSNNLDYGNFTNRTELEYPSGDMIISNANGCTDDQRFTCEILGDSYYDVYNVIIGK